MTKNLWRKGIGHRLTGHHHHRLRHRQVLENESIVAKQKQQRKHPRTPGPKPEVLKIKGDCRDAIKKSLEKKKPTSDWAK